MLMRFCDRCGADLRVVAWCRLAWMSAPETLGYGDIDGSWDLCPACMAQVTAFVTTAQAARAIVVTMQSLGELD